MRAMMPNAQPTADSVRYRWTVLVMLTLVYTFNFIDRQILVILQEPIKVDLGLSDAQLGLLTGFSFALVYVTAGIPIAWLADRSNRRNIVAASLAFWSDDRFIGTGTKLCSAVSRSSGCRRWGSGRITASHSMMATTSRRAVAALPSRSTAWASILACSSVSPPAAGLLAGWRNALSLVSWGPLCPSSVILVEEPKRGQFSRRCPQTSLSETMACLRSRPTFGGYPWVARSLPLSPMATATSCLRF